ncbi:MAG: hypothetical protein ABFD49_08330 [Armatimonadota bacterium]|nr:hypothetical protein [bacterium]
MRITYIIALAALIVSAGAVYAADCPTCYVQPNLNTVCPKCPAPAWNRTPMCEIQPPTYGCAGRGPAVIAVDPWVRCGAFCSAGQIAPGWPYGWNAPYWQRPDSNF